MNASNANSPRGFDSLTENKDRLNSENIIPNSFYCLAPTGVSQFRHLIHLINESLVDSNFDFLMSSKTQLEVFQDFMFNDVKIIFVEYNTHNQTIVAADYMTV